MRVLTGIVAATALLCCPTASQARKLPAMVTIKGTVSAGAEHGCLIMHPSGGPIYNVTAATPKPGVGQYGVMVGAVSHGPTICQQGIQLKPAHWRRLR